MTRSQTARSRHGRGNCSFELIRNPNGALGLHALHHPNYGTVHADWFTPDIARRIAAGRHQPLARAIGLHKRSGLRVLDATGGLGRDAYIFAALGADVTLLERDPLIFQLLQDAKVRAEEASKDNSGNAGRITLVHADAIEILKSGVDFVDVVYLDPMYPEDGKSALPSKAMQLLREITEGDTDSDSLFIAALATGKRITVKRPRNAPYLAEKRPDSIIRSTHLRFDIYLHLRTSN